MFKAGTRDELGEDVLYGQWSGHRQHLDRLGPASSPPTSLSASSHSTSTATTSSSKCSHPPNFDTWYHVVVTVEPSGLQISYVNGVMSNYLTNGVYPRAVARTESYIGKSEWVADSYLQHQDRHIPCVRHVTQLGAGCATLSDHTARTVYTTNQQLV